MEPELAMPTRLDIGFAIVFAILFEIAHAVYFNPRDRQRVANSVPTARRIFYRRTMIGEWSLALLAVLLWAREGRSWSALGLLPPTDWRLIVGLALVAVTTVLAMRQAASVRRLSDDRLDKLRPKLAGHDLIVPQTLAEYRWFIALALTAGVCEELLYRGFLTWLVAAYLPVVVAIIIVSITFGLGHAYLGRRGIVNAGIVGLVMSTIVLASGWLIPAMVIHTLIDISSAIVGYRVLGRHAVRPTQVA
jgi:membrane protease YdiL (CAAX protease family)